MAYKVMSLKNENPRISIITAVHNGAATIENTIQSVINQSYDNIEYIVIDACSDDGTQNIVQHHIDQIDRCICEPDEGIYDAFNKGVLMSSGDIIGIINSDDWYEPDAINKVVRCFINSDADIVYGNCNRIIDNKTAGKLPVRNLRFLIWDMCIPHPAVFVKKNVYERIGLFDKKYKIAADYDFILRAYLGGVRFCYLDDTISNFRFGGVSTTNEQNCTDETDQIVLRNINLHRFFAIIKQFIPEIKSIYIFGAGEWGGRLAKILKLTDISVTGFIDNMDEKQGTLFNSIMVYAPEVLRSDESQVGVIICNMQYEDVIYDQLIGMKLSSSVVILKLSELILEYSEIQ